jgi:xylulokinase
MIDAVMEGVTFNLNISLENLEELGLKKGDFTVVGGGSKSEKWNQLKANILQRKVVSMVHKEGGTLGASILAGYGAGIFTSLKDASLQMAKIEKTYYPQEKKITKHASKYEIFKEIYPSLKEINHQISQLNF